MNVYDVAVLKGRIASSCSSAGPERKILKMYIIIWSSTS